MDLIKTLEDDAEVAYESEEDSGGEGDEIAAAKKVTKIKKNSNSKPKQNAGPNSAGEFFDEFSFVNDAKEYMKDTW
jgi:hypothetical protein